MSGHPVSGVSRPGPAPGSRPAPAPQRTGLLILGIILLAANLRAPLTTVGPLVPAIRETLGISHTAAGSLTTVPLIAFALLSPFAPRLARRFGTERTLLVSLLLLLAGILIRSGGSAGALFGGTFLLGLSIAVCNVLLPGLIKRDFPRNLGVMTGTYSVAMNLCGAIASGLSVPLASLQPLGWTGALRVWSLLALTAGALWLPLLRNRDAGQPPAVKARHEEKPLWRSSLAWQVTVFMGLQSLIFYTVIAWLPAMLQKQYGLTSGAAGWMLSLAQLAILPFTFLVPVVAGRMRSQRSLAALTALSYVAGLAGILYGHSAALLPLWVILIGMASGSAFSLAMMFITLRARTSGEAAELSGMAQSLGYLLAAAGPVLFGWLHDATDSWELPLQLMLAAGFLIFVFGMGAGRAKHVR
ncbi:MFS transporter [Paenibacillus sp. J31TS4]|uniref:CynX/NimT family MFS transporter n=1 Tax=Paenibacillus sp. J31TS4 TaxID=2807195 RepID=UPI001AFD6FDB|nr:MFS transporter [Paenibacillus sp. J31TS4]GIP41416.1 MFS transporter [Paenibacillus sp. J31TS4]